VDNPFIQIKQDCKDIMALTNYDMFGNDLSSNILPSGAIVINMDNPTTSCLEIINSLKLCAAYVSKLTSSIDIIKKDIDILLSLKMSDLYQMFIKEILYYEKYFQIVTLYITKSILKVKTYISETIKNMIDMTIMGKIAGPLNPLFGVIITTIQILSSAMMTISTSLMILYNTLGETPIGIPGFGVSFFLTPKTLIKNPTKVANEIEVNNENSAINLNKINSKFAIEVNTILLAAQKTNNAIQITNIANAASYGLSNWEKDDFSTANTTIKKASWIKIKPLLNSISSLLNTNPEAEALPKYENITPLNIGFLNYLGTGFCTTGCNCFGWPF
jgi:hypothetical protein